jgi:hypothetical protein
MKRLLPLALVVLFGCSKQDSTTTETIQQAAVPQSTAPAERAVLKLTPEEVEDAAWQILIKFHDDNLMGDADLMAYIEELAVEGDHILYKLVRHNGNDAGWHSDVEEEDNPPYEEDYIEETDEERQQREVEEEMAAEQEAAEIEYQERYGIPRTTPDEQVQPTWYYKNEFDTLIYDGHFVAYLEEGSPEAATKKVRIVFTDKLKHVNSPTNQGLEEPYGEIETAPGFFGVSDILVEAGKPIVVDRNWLYLRAKMADLTEQDLAGMTKDELAFTRNEIFARHGHTFKTPKMMNYFNEKRWYGPLVDDAAPLLNKFEKRNVEFIKKKEG